MPILSKRKFFSLLVILLALTSFFSFSHQKPIQQAQAQGTYLVPDDFTTIQAAVDVVQPGDTIMIRGGTYNESVNISRSGQSGHPITLTNYGNDRVTINGSGNPALRTAERPVSWWVIEGLNFDSSNSYTIQFWWGYGHNHWTLKNNLIYGSIWVYGSYHTFENNELDGSYHHGTQHENAIWETDEGTHHNVYRNNHIHDYNSRGIWSMRRTHDSLFEGNYIHHIGVGLGGVPHCINMDSCGSVTWRHIIRDNHVHDCGHNGIAFENTYDSVIENNLVHDVGNNTKGWGIVVMNYGPNNDNNYCLPNYCQAGGENNQYGIQGGCEGDSTGNIIRQNLLYNAGGWASIEGYDVGDVKVLGNTVFGSTGIGVELHGNCPGWEVRSNIIFGNQTTIQGSPSVEDHNLFSDPRFINPSGHDFHLQSDSPAIDAGIDIGLTTDLDGNTRLRGAGYDIGVYEYQEGVQPTSTPIPTPTPSSAPASPTPTPTPFLGLSWEAEEGEITSPFSVINGYISQSVRADDPFQAGKALYRFNLTAPGDYVIKTLVDAPDEGTNSFFVNIDAEPETPAMIWDIYPLTSSFEERIVSWRGSGGASSNEFVPKVFTLSSGEHELIIRGREPDVKLDKVSLVLIIPLSSGWNQITWPNLTGIKASNVPPECPMAVTQENFLFRPYVKNYGGVNFNFESGATYFLRCNRSTSWNL